MTRLGEWVPADCRSRPEHTLLLDSCAVNLPEDRLHRIRIAAAGVTDWPYVVGLARLHAVVPLLFRSLKTTCSSAVPEDVLRSLRDHFTVIRRRNLYLAGELLQILNGLRTEAIVAIPYKGPALARTLYGNFSLRQWNDLDILIPDGKIARAQQLLMDQGFRPMAGSETGGKHIRLLRGSDGLKVELHWAVTARYFNFPIDCSSLPLRPLSFSGSVVPSPSAEDILLLLSAHGTRHCWSRLSWICDIAELLRSQPELDWSAIHARAAKLHAQRMVSLAILLAHGILGANLPEEIARRIHADRVAVRLAAETGVNLFRKATGKLASAEALLFLSRSRERRRDGWRVLLHLAGLKLRPFRLL